MGYDIALGFTLFQVRHTPTCSLTHQQAVGGVDRNAAGEWVVDGERVQVGTALVYVTAHMEVDWVAVPLCLLSHVLQLHLRHVHWGEISQDLHKHTHTGEIQS